MSNQLSKRLARLEAAIKPGAAWWNGLTWKELITGWQDASGRGLYLDFATGQAVTYGELHQVDPVRAGRLATVESMEEQRDYVNQAIE